MGGMADINVFSYIQLNCHHRTTPATRAHTNMWPQFWHNAAFFSKPVKHGRVYSQVAQGVVTR